MSRETSKITSDEFLENFSVFIRDNRTGDIGFVKVEDFLWLVETAGGEE